MLNLSEFTYYPLVVSLIAGVLLYYLFLILKVLITRGVKGDRFKLRVLAIIPLIERTTWVVFTAFLILSIVKVNPVWGTLLVGVLIASTWLLIRNYISGTLLLFNRQYKIGQFLKIMEYQGEIIDFGKTKFTLVQAKGEKVVLPYSYLINTPLITTNRSENITNQHIVLEIEKPCDIQREKAKIFQQLVYSPWIIPGAQPFFEIKQEMASHYELHITIELMDKSHIEHVSELLKK